MEIVFSKVATKIIQNMDKPTKKRIKDGIDGLVVTPPIGDIKPLQGYNDGILRLRIGKYRIIYKYMQDGTVEILYILDIGSRGDIYK